MAQQLVEAHQCLFELGAASAGAVAAHGAAGLVGGAAIGARQCAGRGRQWHARQQRGQRSRARHFGDGTAEARARRQDNGAIKARLHALRLEAGRSGGCGVLEQAGGDSGRCSQDDRALDLRCGDRAGRIPERGRVDERAKRIRFGADVALADQRRGEGLQLAQLPLGGAVDQLHRARDLDVDLDPRFVHQLQPAAFRFRKCSIALLVELFRDLAAQRIDERLLVERRVALQRRHEVGVVDAFAAGRCRFLRGTEQLHRSGEHAGDERRCECQLVVDEALEERSDRHGRMS